MRVAQAPRLAQALALVDVQHPLSQERGQIANDICTDPTLLVLYNSLDGGKRYEFHYRGWVGYNLPTLLAGKPFGTARNTEIVVAIVDTGNFMDPRSCNEWWQVRPGYGDCP